MKSRDYYKNSLQSGKFSKLGEVPVNLIKTGTKDFGNICKSTFKMMLSLQRMKSIYDVNSSEKK